jgi:hypothetical protein
MIDWINQFDEPACLLVSTYEDLLDGVALCHLVAKLCCSDQEQHQLQYLIKSDDAQQNLDLALQVLKASDAVLPDSVKKLSYIDLVSNPKVNLFLICDVLKQIWRDGIPQVETRPKQHVQYGTP